MIYSPNQLPCNIVSFHKITSHYLELGIEIQSHLIKLPQPLTQASKCRKLLIIRKPTESLSIITIETVVPSKPKGVRFGELLLSIVSEMSDISSNSRYHRHVDLKLVKSQLVGNKLLIRFNRNPIGLVNWLFLSLSSN